MSLNSDIRDGIIEIVRRAHLSSDKSEFFTAEVTDVQEDKRTCTVISISSETQMEYSDVGLMPQVADGILYVPKVGSIVVVENNTNLQPYVFMFSELDKVLLVTGDQSIEMKDGGIKFNNGSFYGLVKVKELTDKLNNLENKVNDLIGTYNSHTHIVVTTAASGTWTSATGLPQESGTLTPTTQSEIENKVITHGDKNN